MNNLKITQIFILKRLKKSFILMSYKKPILVLAGEQIVFF